MGQPVATGTAYRSRLHAEVKPVWTLPNASAPPYRPEQWRRGVVEGWARSLAPRNSRDTDRSVFPNCYAYATGAPYLADTGGTLLRSWNYLLPHRKDGEFNEARRSTEVRRDIVGAQIDGLQFLGANPKTIPPHTYLIAYYRTTPTNDGGKQVSDYHFVRQNRDGTWSQIPGTLSGVATNRDVDGRIITDPIKAHFKAFDSTYEFIGFFAAPEGGLNPKQDGVLRPGTGEAALRSYGGDPEDQVSGRHIVARFKGPDGDRYIQKIDGQWTLIEFGSQLRTTDDMGRKITDPRTATFTDSKLTFEGLFTVPDYQAAPKGTRGAPKAGPQLVTPPL